MILTTQALKNALVTADIIQAIYKPTGRKHVIWKRPLAEIQARGLPSTIIVVNPQISSKPELRRLAAYVNALKYGN